MTIQTILKSQYHASLAMLLDAIDGCPDRIWTSDAHTNPYWHIAYHTLYYTHLYLQPDASTFTPWAYHRPDHHRFGPRHQSAGPLVPYVPAELAGYGRQCDALVDAAVDRLDLAATSSGFPGYPIGKLEHQIVNLRHLHHHTGQLADRLRQAVGRGIAWIGGMPTPRQ